MAVLSFFLELLSTDVGISRFTNLRSLELSYSNGRCSMYSPVAFLGLFKAISAKHLQNLTLFFEVPRHVKFEKLPQWLFEASQWRLIGEMLGNKRTFPALRNVFLLLFVCQHADLSLDLDDLAKVMWRSCPGLDSAGQIHTRMWVHILCFIYSAY
jgi:hypothetical protein